MGLSSTAGQRLWPASRSTPRLSYDRKVPDLLHDRPDGQALARRTNLMYEGALGLPHFAGPCPVLSVNAYGNSLPPLS